MKRNDSNRRKFLRNTLAGSGAIAGVAALGVPAPAAARGKATKKAITRDGKPVSPEAIFSPAIQLGQLLFVSGAGAHDPITHKVVEGPISNQVRQCLENIKGVLEAAGSSMDRALKCTVFLKEIGDYQEMNKVYHSFFTKDPPARSTVAVKDLPGDSPVEIECIAYVD
jgi:2-iminobutanoate/2-iminopropanoate deaminase